MVKQMSLVSVDYEIRGVFFHKEEQCIKCWCKKIPFNRANCFRLLWSCVAYFEDICVGYLFHEYIGHYCKVVDQDSTWRVIIIDKTGKHVTKEVFNSVITRPEKEVLHF